MLPCFTFFTPCDGSADWLAWGFEVTPARQAVHERRFMLKVIFCFASL